MREVEELISRFLKSFPNSSPIGIAKAPGRINLIGEHTDYNGLPVLPFAIPRYIKVVFSQRRDQTVLLKNTDSAFMPASYRASESIPPDPEGSWVNYTKAAVQDLTKLVQRKRGQIFGMEALVCGDIPQAGGLSSSSALCVATGLSFLKVNQIDLDKLTLAERMARAERYVGTQGGGMDQAASLCSQKDHVLRIDFFPLKVKPIPFPREFAVVACHSLKRAPKGKEARSAYNLRVAECRLGCELLKKAFKVEGSLLSDFYKRWGSKECLEALSEILGKKEPKSIAEIARILDSGEEDLARKFFPEGIPKEAEKGLKILSRCTHVLTEADRVEAACKALEEKDPKALGKLMIQAHHSASSCYEISTPELDALVKIMLGAGAYGARLTGAGFGGFAIGLVPASIAEDVIKEVDENFYKGKVEKEGLRKVRFVFRPSEGASVTETQH